MSRTSTKRWSDLTPAQQAGVVVLGAAQIGLQAYVLTDIARRDPRQINGNKAAWVAASFLNFIGPVAYIVKGIRK